MEMAALLEALWFGLFRGSSINPCFLAEGGEKEEKSRGKK
jgi:hypothetical protein